MSDGDRESSLEFLRGRGLSLEDAENFLESKVTYQTMQVEAHRLREVLEVAERYGVVFGPASVGIMVPRNRLEAFQKALDVVMAKHGGFVIKNREEELLSRLKREVLN